MNKKLVLVVVFAVLALMSGCATYGARGAMPNLNNIVNDMSTGTKGDITVSSYSPKSTAEVKEYFDKDLFAEGIFPVFVKIQNNAIASDISLVSVNLIIEGSAPVAMMTPQEVYEIVKRGWWGKSTFWWFFGLYVGAPISAAATHHTNNKILEDMNGKVLTLGEIGDTKIGFVCFRTGYITKPPDGALVLIFKRGDEIVECNLGVQKIG